LVRFSAKFINKIQYGGFSAYCASKSGVAGLTGVLAHEISEPGIRIYAVLPGAVNTGLLAASNLEIDPADALQPEYLAEKTFGRRRAEKNPGP
jgi:NAD(P)-dependent dehydrogenase (short-subunit alcohol dehydrogenase family)